MVYSINDARRISNDRFVRYFNYILNRISAHIEHSAKDASNIVKIKSFFINNDCDREIIWRDLSDNNQKLILNELKQAGYDARDSYGELIISW